MSTFVKSYTLTLTGAEVEIALDALEAAAVRNECAGAMHRNGGRPALARSCDEQGAMKRALAAKLEAVFGPHINNR
jgi:hypothetical protein